MDRNQLNRQGRPYNRTCGMMKASACMSGNGRRQRTQSRAASDAGCACMMPGSSGENRELLSKVQGLPDAMAYVPCQEFSDTYDLSCAYLSGTIFPALCKPFCGKGRCAR